MTTEEKAKAYDEALERAQKATRAGSDVAMDIVQYIFPNLTESDDERIRKDIINLIYWLAGNPSLCSRYYRDRYDGMLAWLEKQKDITQAKVEQRMEYLWDKLPDAHRVEEGNCTPEEWKALGAYMELEMNFDKGSEEEQQEQKPAWSEEDEQIAKEIEEELWYPGDFPDYPSKEENELYDDCQRRLNWFKDKLKSLRPQPKRDCKDCAMFLNGKCTKPHWKPSEGQMKYLLMLANYFESEGGTSNAKTLRELYEQLKKLM